VIWPLGATTATPPARNTLRTDPAKEYAMADLNLTSTPSAPNPMIFCQV
jgi:hypothetical protein